MPKSPASTARRVAGVDGCRAGWVVGRRVARPPREMHFARVVPKFHAEPALPEAPAVIAVDVPIGLLGMPAQAAVPRGARPAAPPHPSFESSVFSAPTRAALAAFRAGGDYQAVSTANRGGVEMAQVSPGRPSELLPHSRKRFLRSWKRIRWLPQVFRRSWKCLRRSPHLSPRLSERLPPVPEAAPRVSASLPPTRRRFRRSPHPLSVRARSRSTMPGLMRTAGAPSPGPSSRLRPSEGGG